MQDSGSLAVFKVTARDQGHYKGPSGAFVTYCNISCFKYHLSYNKLAKSCLSVDVRKKMNNQEAFSSKQADKQD